MKFTYNFIVVLFLFIVLTTSCLPTFKTTAVDNDRPQVPHLQTAEESHEIIWSARNVPFFPHHKQVTTPEIETLRSFVISEGRQMRALQISPNQSHILTHTGDGAYLEELKSGEQIRRLDVRASVFASDEHWQFSPDGSLLIYAFNSRSTEQNIDRDIRVFDGITGELLQRFSFDPIINDLTITRNNQILAVAAGNPSRAIYFIDLGSGRTKNVLRLPYSSTGLSPDGSQIVVWGRDRNWNYYVRILDTQSDDIVHTLLFVSDQAEIEPADAVFSPDGSEVAVALRRSTGRTVAEAMYYYNIRIYDAETGDMLRRGGVQSSQFHTDTMDPWSIRYSHDSSTLLRQFSTDSFFHVEDGALKHTQYGGNFVAFDANTLRPFYAMTDPFKETTPAAERTHRPRVVPGTDAYTFAIIQNVRIGTNWKNRVAIQRLSRFDWTRITYPDGSELDVPYDARGFELVQKWARTRFDNLSRSENILPEKLRTRQAEITAREQQLAASQPEPPRAEQGQFETTAQYRQRVLRLRNEYQQKARRWEQEAELYNREADQLEQDINAFYQNILWPGVVNKTFRMVFGNPVIKQAEYNADARVFTVTIGSDQDWAGDFSQQLMLRKSFVNLTEEGPKFLKELKQTNPEIRFEISGSGIDWASASVEIQQTRYTMNPPEGELRQRASIEMADLSSQVELRRGGSIEARAPMYEWDVPTRTGKERAQSIQFYDDLREILDHVEPVPENPNHYLFAIGIEVYSEAPDVPFSERSTEFFREVANKRLGVPNTDRNMTVLTGRDATVGRIDARLEQMLARLRDDDVLFFYYSGHGVPSRTGDAAYILAQDASPGSYDRFEQFSLQALYNRLDSSRARQIFGFIDACFSGQVNEDQLVFEGVAPAGRLLRGEASPTRLPDKLTLLTAGTDEQFSNAYFERQHRLFSYWLMKGIMENYRGQQLVQYVRSNVEDSSLEMGSAYHQTPEFFGVSNIDW